MARRDKEEGEPSVPSVPESIWKPVCSLDTPAIVKTFLWKALKDCLPTWLNLMKKKIIEVSMCPIGGRFEEFICHSLWKCPASSNVWTEFEDPVHKWPNVEGDFVVVWEKMARTLGRESLEMVAVIMRGFGIEETSSL